MADWTGAELIATRAGNGGGPGTVCVGPRINCPQEQRDRGPDVGDGRWVGVAQEESPSPEAVNNTLARTGEDEREQKIEPFVSSPVLRRVGERQM